MKGYSLFQKGKDKPIKIGLENILVFATKKDLKASIDIEYDEEIRQVEIVV